jgi:two-component system response regulator AlgR
MREATSDAPFTAVIVDDEPLAIEGVRRLCAASPLVEIVGEASDGPAALDLVARARPQAVFLDIAMPGMSGLDVARALRAGAAPPHVVLVTANDHFATEAFDLAVVDYVLKPIDPARLDRAIERVASLMQQHAPAGGQDDALWVPYRGSIVRLAVGDIRRIDAERDYVRVNDAHRSYLLRATMAELCDRLGDGFLRIHRSTAIARDRVTGLRHAGGGSWMAVDAEGEAFPIGRTYLADVRASLMVGEDGR